MNRSRSNKPKKSPKPFKMPTVVQIIRPCSNCGEEGPHFVPPSFGDPGFFICVSLEEKTQNAPGSGE